MPTKQQIKPLCIWFTGLSGAGKSSIADELRRMLVADGLTVSLLDGDVLRLGLNKDLGFSDADRSENIRRVAEVAKIMVDSGVIVLAALISPFSEDRDRARSLFLKGNFVEIFVDTPLAVCESRDVKGLYKRARQGTITAFTGIDSPYEPPCAPEMRIDGSHDNPTIAALKVIDYVKRI